MTKPLPKKPKSWDNVTIQIASSEYIRDEETRNARNAINRHNAEVEATGKGQKVGMPIRRKRKPNPPNRNVKDFVPPEKPEQICQFRTVAVIISEKLLAERWYCSIARLQRWRSRKMGPPYVKIGGRILYRISDIEAYEQSCLIIPGLEE